MQLKILFVASRWELPAFHHNTSFMQQWNHQVILLDADSYEKIGAKMGYQDIIVVGEDPGVYSTRVMLGKIKNDFPKAVLVAVGPADDQEKLVSAGAHFTAETLKSESSVNAFLKVVNKVVADLVDQKMKSVKHVATT